MKIKVKTREEIEKLGFEEVYDLKESYLKNFNSSQTIHKPMYKYFGKEVTVTKKTSLFEESLFYDNWFWSYEVLELPKLFKVLYLE